MRVLKNVCHCQCLFLLCFVTLKISLQNNTTMEYFAADFCYFNDDFYVFKVDFGLFLLF